MIEEMEVGDIFHVDMHHKQGFIQLMRGRQTNIPKNLIHHGKGRIP
jgi:hypothetical protein